MLLFFPEAYEAIDFQHVEFLSETVYTDMINGEQRHVDLLVKTELKDEPSIIIIHLKPQSYKQDDFNQRMFLYYSHLYYKYRYPILPIAIFSYDHIRTEPDAFTIQFPFKNVLQFQYYILELRKKNWRDYIKQNNPVAAALLSKMGYNNKERIQGKLEFLRMIARLQLDVGGSD